MPSTGGPLPPLFDFTEHELSIDPRLNDKLLPRGSGGASASPAGGGQPATLGGKSIPKEQRVEESVKEVNDQQAGVFSKKITAQVFFKLIRLSSKTC